MDKSLPIAIVSVPCAKHDMTIGEPCYIVESYISRKWYVGVCNDRAVKAGFYGKISPASLRAKR